MEANATSRCATRSSPPISRTNGGPTLTHLLASGAGGAAADHGDPLGCTDDAAAPLVTDQRGVKRPIGSACDLASFEGNRSVTRTATAS